MICTRGMHHPWQCVRRGARCPPCAIKARRRWMSSRDRVRSRAAPREPIRSILSTTLRDERNQKTFATRLCPRQCSTIYPQGTRQRCRARSETLQTATIKAFPRSGHRIVAVCRLRIEGSALHCASLAGTRAPRSPMYAGGLSPDRSTRAIHTRTCARSTGLRAPSWFPFHSTDRLATRHRFRINAFERLIRAARPMSL